MSLACALAAGAAAQERLDAGASPRQQVHADLEWTVPLARAGSASRRAFGHMTARVRALDLRLDVSRYLDRDVRIFMSVPLPVHGLTGAGGMRINWRSEGLFEDGTLVPGEHALLYAGPVREPELRDRLQLEIEMEWDAIDGGEIRFEPQFHIEPR